MKRSPWFSARTQPPVRPGVYEYAIANRFPWVAGGAVADRLTWTGAQWEDRAYPIAVTIIVWPGDMWRGLAEPPPAAPSGEGAK
jgi:hypothetical protein